MSGQELTFAGFREAVGGLDQEGLEYRGQCPLCSAAGLVVRIHGPGPGEWEPRCIACGARADHLRQEAWRVLHPGSSGTNGSVPTEKPPSVASVAYFPESGSVWELPAEALYGLPGAAVSTISPHTESHPAAILASFLAGSGCLVGRGPHVWRDAGRLSCAEFFALVGRSAKGRKGSATRRANQVLQAVLSDTNISNYDILPFHDPNARAREGKDWNELLFGGLGSGEALVESLANAAEAGEEAPRRFIIEEEFSKPLKVMRREGSLLSETLRHAWDGAVLANRTKGKALVAVHYHVSVLVHTTEEELQQNLARTEAYNGFANRFLWMFTSRVRSLPFGGGEAPLAPVVSQLHAALEFARTAGEYQLDPAAARIWGEGGVYDALIDQPAGLLGAICSRAEAHVTRLALLYAVLDRAPAIGVPHLLAALGVWDYAARSAAAIFGQSTGDDYADLILEYLWEVHPGALTRTELRDRFKRHAEPGRIPKALATLEALGAIERHEVAGPGRYAEAWLAKNRKICDRSDGSPLELARSLAT